MSVNFIFSFELKIGLNSIFVAARSAFNFFVHLLIFFFDLISGLKRKIPDCWWICFGDGFSVILRTEEEQVTFDIVRVLIVLFWQMILKVWSKLTLSFCAELRLSLIFFPCSLLFPNFIIFYFPQILNVFVFFLQKLRHSFFIQLQFY